VGDLPELLATTPYLAAKPPSGGTKLTLFGCPFDGTVSFRPGARFGPAAIRSVSDVLETYCPRLKRDLEDVDFADAGDLLLPFGDSAKALDLIYQMAKHVLASGQVTAALGGEHLISLSPVRAALETHPDLRVIQFDAHMDMRNDYLGVELSHATVMRRISDIMKESHILQVGQRSGTRAEFERAERLGTIRPQTVTAQEIRQWAGDWPIYVTVDLDVLDPSVLPGTGTPEPGGVSFQTLQDWLIGLAGCHWVGWDAVELSPIHDATQASSIASAKIVRTMILASTV
jgi:agmatinase